MEGSASAAMLAPSRPRRRYAAGRPRATPDPPVASSMSAMASPMARRCRSLQASTIACDTPPDRSASSRAAMAASPASTSAKGTSPTFRGVWRDSTRTRLGSRIGVSGWSRIGESESSTSPTKRWPWKTERPVSGNAGQAMASLAPSASSRASATGPILPSSVESKVEQYLKKNRRAPARRSQDSAASDWSTASPAGIVRDLSATTIASASGTAKSAGGTPTACTVRIPSRTSVLHRSVAPVRSSAMAPSRQVDVMSDGSGGRCAGRAFCVRGAGPLPVICRAGRAPPAIGTWARGRLA